PQTNTSLVVEDLQPGKLYIVQVHSQALANGQLLVSRSSSYFFATPPGLSGDGGGDAGSRQLLGRGGEIDKYVRINSESRLGSNSARVWLSARTISLCLLACLTAVNFYAA
uniref:Fibronectin type-III domain-containing protein n=1 Tax=Macrostomum lignano TaxID=282301 RepID=A0A1I8IC81_9PLAT